MAPKHLHTKTRGGRIRVFVYRQNGYSQKYWATAATLRRIERLARSPQARTDIHKGNVTIWWLPG